MKFAQLTLDSAFKHYISLSEEIIASILAAVILLTLPLITVMISKSMMIGSAHTVKENAAALVDATKEIGLEVNVDKTKYMIMSRDQNAGRS
jgi:hypothetical protein